MPSQVKVSRLKRRAGRLQAEMRSGGLEGVIIVPGPNLAYYTGVAAHLFERPFLFFVQRDRDARLLAPRLEAGPFRGLPLEVYDWDDTEGPSRALAELLGGIEKRGKWGCEGRVPYSFLEPLLRGGLRVTPADRVLQSIREVKEPEELELLSKSAEILSAALLKVPEALREGATEKEVSRSILEEAVAGGADEVDPMVQSGARASDPHSATSTKRIARGESVVVDVVSSYRGYAADITRTFALGSGGPVEKTYESVLSAQERAIETARAGATTGEVDAAARASLSAEGLGEFFFHRTGHGLGLEVHEAPFILSGGKERLRAGMVFTVEPGVYLEGRLGVRIEDDVVLSGSGGREVTTRRVPKEYGWWRR